MGRVSWFLGFLVFEEWVDAFSVVSVGHTSVVERRKIRRVAVCGIRMLVAGGLLLAFRQTDPFREVRDLHPIEKISKQDGWMWHEFQFVDSCRDVIPRLNKWRASLETPGGRFVFTGPEDSDGGPSIWGNIEFFTMRSPLQLDPSCRCGFAVAVREDRSILTRVSDAIRLLLQS